MEVDAGEEDTPGAFVGVGVSGSGSGAGRAPTSFGGYGVVESVGPVAHDAPFNMLGRVTRGLLALHKRARHRDAAASSGDVPSDAITRPDGTLALSSLLPLLGARYQVGVRF
eukprot:SAG11_NODE_3241_length_2589_cov_1.544578_1_plen_112_part_00